MKILNSRFLRAVIAAIVGALLIKYRENMVTWLTIAIGVMFFLSGVVSLAGYYSARRQANGPQVFDANGQQIRGNKPPLPIVGLGSLILGLVLALMPNTFIETQMYLLSALLILGAVGQFVGLASATKFAHVGWGYWVLPSVILLVALIAILRPSAIASAPLFVIGWCMLLYGVVEAINALKIQACQRRKAREETHEAEAVEIDSRPLNAPDEEELGH